VQDKALNLTWFRGGGWGDCERRIGMTPYEEAFKGKRVLVTGGLGFIGSNLMARLVELKANVTLVDNMLPRLGGNLFNIKPFADRIHINFSDVRD
jgi:FlaA1/EpsC-like NDP-sugar epimerase